MLGQPCNQFGGQEPGDNSEIVNCVEYVRPGNGYKIPANMALTQKGDVNGLLETSLFKTLKAACGGADVGWNFELWTVTKEGKPNKLSVNWLGPYEVINKSLNDNEYEIKHLATNKIYYSFNLKKIYF